MRNALVVGPRLYLRPSEKEDGGDLARFQATEPETFMERGRVPFSPLAFDALIDDIFKQQPPSEVWLTACAKAGDALIGAFQLFDIDWINRTAETGAWIYDPAYRGQGYGTEAKHLLLEYAFDHLQLHALNSYVWEPNVRSASAVQKQGYRPAGRLKWEDVKHGVHRDALLFDLLRDEWVVARDAWRVSLAAREQT
ncbi:MAG TPA: GNAT family protein [Thermomicrobiales bacterium]|nr:hypothetical protein [Chloroflexota bacterium]HQZ90605.1 GNAT family protein [Thermomicrobiales bacterium]